MSVFGRFKSWLIGEFSDAEKDVVAGLEAAIKSVEANGGKVLMDAATNGVAAAEAAGGTSAVKLVAAVSAVTATLAAEGITVVMNAVNIAIEAAVAQMKANQAATAA